jgi:hypothetical protein
MPILSRMKFGFTRRRSDYNFLYTPHGKRRRIVDHIALIHKSNKLIEGKLDEVKDNLKPIVLKWAFYPIM